MRHPDNTARGFFSGLSADEIVKELFQQPVMTISELYGDPGVQTRIADILDFAKYRRRNTQPKKSAVAADYALPKITASHYRFYGRRS